MVSFARIISDTARSGRRQGSPLRSDRSRGKALTALLPGQTMQLSGAKETKKSLARDNHQEWHLHKILHTLSPNGMCARNPLRRHLREGSQVSKARPGAPIILSRRFSHRLFRAGQELISQVCPRSADTQRKQSRTCIHHTRDVVVQSLARWFPVVVAQSRSRHWTD